MTKKDYSYFSSNRYLKIFVIIFFLFVFSKETQGSLLPNIYTENCIYKFDFIVEKSSIALILQDNVGTTEFIFKLYDLNLGKFVEETGSVSISQGKKIIIFSSVVPSRYLIFASIKGCSQAIQIGGINGIGVDK